MEFPGENGKTEGCEPVSDEVYEKRNRAKESVKVLMQNRFSVFCHFSLRSVMKINMIFTENIL